MPTTRIARAPMGALPPALATFQIPRLTFAGGAAGAGRGGGGVATGPAAGARGFANGRAAAAPAGGGAGASRRAGTALLARTTSAGGAAGTGGTGGTTNRGGAAGTTSAGGAAGATGGSGGTGGTAGGYDYTPPFVVDNTSYSPSTADSAWGNTGTLKLEACVSRAPGTPVGSCHEMTYNWSATTGTNCAASDAGVGCAWTAQTWKSVPSKKIAPGATKIQFYAWGNGKVTFKEPTATATHDLPVTLTATPTQYTVDLTGLAYYLVPQEVALLVVFVSADTGTVVNIDDLRWL